MSLIGGNGQFQDLLGQSASVLNIDADDVTISNSLCLDFATPNKVLITDANSCVTTQNEVFVVQADADQVLVTESPAKTFTLSLPQDINTGSIPTFGGLITTGQIRPTDGTAAAPAYSFVLDDDTGFYRMSTGTTIYSADGTAIWRADSVGIRPFVTSTYNLGSNLLRWLIVYSDAVTVTNNVTAGGVLGGASANITNNIIVGGTVDGRNVSVDGSVLDNLNTTIGLGGLTAGQVDQLKNIQSTISVAQWNFVGDLDQALTTTDSVSFAELTIDNLNFNLNTISTTSGNLNLTPTGSNNVRITANHLRLVNTNDPATPVYGFDGNTNVGMYPSATNQLSFSSNSLERLRIASDGDVTIFEDTFLDNLTATRPLYLDSSKTVQALNLGVDEVLTFNGTDIISASLSELQGAFVNLNGHFDPNRLAATLTITGSTAGKQLVGSTSTAFRFAQTHESFVVPVNTNLQRLIRFGACIVAFSAANVFIGFGTSAFDLTANTVGQPAYGVNTSGSGTIIEDGVNIGNIGATISVGDYLEVEIRTNSKWRIYHNGVLSFTSTNTVTSGTYFPLYGDGDATSSSFTLEISPSTNFVDMKSQTVNTGDLFVTDSPYYTCTYGSGNSNKVSNINASLNRNLGENVTGGISVGTASFESSQWDDTDSWIPIYTGLRTRLFRVTAVGSLSTDSGSISNPLINGTLLQFIIRKNSSSIMQNKYLLTSDFSHFALDVIVELSTNDDIKIRLQAAAPSTNTDEFFITGMTLTIVPLLNDASSL